MNIFMAEQPQIELMGICTRTTNAEEAGPKGKLPGLWEAFFRSGLTTAAEVAGPHRIYALYTDYEDGVNGAYSVLIGCEVKEGTPNDGFVHAVIPAGRYKVFTSDRGAAHEVVPRAWGEIWDYFKGAPDERAYTGDYEVYDSVQGDSGVVEVQIYIAVK